MNKPIRSLIKQMKEITHKKNKINFLKKTKRYVAINMRHQSDQVDGEQLYPSLSQGGISTRIRPSPRFSPLQPKLQFIHHQHRQAIIPSDLVELLIVRFSLDLLFIVSPT